ncbi:P-II family nitrogen regulator [Candidatus Nitrotoga sp. M5]|uniref:P-II family nitrogen regulator n=1 Tax=Candidatus Nitrotoga sp. M5 TaxID=2890409 RepID=UPI001EF35D77|nr:P-II family nitrogen regulator [Candidatus Nitrotoga sp. M5]CAH1385545.1 Transcriptional regulator [Candidatus Nitrotoga sp. M5]
MKEIKAYIHNHRIADVIHALKESGQCNANAGTGCRNLSVIPVQSLLKAVDAKEQHYSIDWAEAVINESKLELICEDGQVDELVDIIGGAARTGQAEAGGFV